MKLLPEFVCDELERAARSADIANDALDWIRKTVLDSSTTEAQKLADIRMILETAATALTGDPELRTTEDGEGQS